MSDALISAQGFPQPARKRIFWRRDPIILARMAEVERRHLAGQSNRTIADGLAVDEGTIRNDLKRLQELWLERIGEQQETLRAQHARELDEIKRLALVRGAK